MEWHEMKWKGMNWSELNWTEMNETKSAGMGLNEAKWWNFKKMVKWSGTKWNEWTEM